MCIRDRFYLVRCALHLRDILLGSRTHLFASLIMFGLVTFAAGSLSPSLVHTALLDVYKRQLALRFKSDLRNSGRIYLTAVRKETSLRSSSTTERARLPHFNEATCGFRSPALAGRIDFREIEFRGETRRRAVLKI